MGNYYLATNLFKSAAKHIKGWNSYNAAENYEVNNNIFDRGRYGLIEIGAYITAWMPHMSGNTYIQYLNSDFGNIGGTATLMNGSTPYYVKKNSGDETAEIYCLPELDQ